MTTRPFRFGVVAAFVREPGEWTAMAQRAESLGYLSLIIPDTLGQTLSPLIALTAAASVTSTLHIGTYVLANDIRHPVLLAREAATLQFLSGGRFELGLGAGRHGIDEDLRKLGLPAHGVGERIRRLEESISIVKALLAGEHVTHQGTYYAVEDADIFPRPEQRPPLLIAASGNRMLALAAREADIIALGVGPHEGRTVADEKIALIRQTAGDRIDDIEINANLMAVGEKVTGWIAGRFGEKVQEFARSGSIAFLMGSRDEMCEQLLERRESLGISYICVSQDLLETFAPVIERLQGT